MNKQLPYETTGRTEDGRDMRLGFVSPKRLRGLVRKHSGEILRNRDGYEVRSRAMFYLSFIARLHVAPPQRVRGELRVHGYRLPSLIAIPRKDLLNLLGEWHEFDERRKAAGRARVYVEFKIVGSSFFVC